jgi:hypothetical protein
MRKTTAGRTLLVLVNVVFIIVAATAIVSAIPPQYNVQLQTFPDYNTSTTLSIPIKITVTNNGFYDINNFYVIMNASNPSGTSKNQTETLPMTIRRGATLVSNVTLELNYTYIHANPGEDYSIVLKIHSEFAFGLIKFTISAPMSQTLS